MHLSSFGPHDGKEPHRRPGGSTISNENKYGFGKYPHGRCHEPGCEKAACHRYSDRVVCRRHLPPEVVFAPFLGQQEKLFTATERWVLGGGGAGGSKTFAGSHLWLKQYALEKARFEAGEISASKGHFLFLRRTMPELLQVISHFKTIMRRIDPNVVWNEVQKTATFPSAGGYVVQFGGMEHDDDWEKYWGGNYSMVVMDEAVQFTVKQIDKIDQRIRVADDEGLGRMLQLYLLTNPIGTSTKLWLKRRFVTVAEPETSVKVRTTLLDGRIVEDWQVYIPSNLYDNPALMEDGKYEASLMMRSEATRRALLLNDWDVDEGAWVGEDWDPSVHICEPFRIPNSWTRFKCADYGFSSRSSVLWFAVDPEGNLVCYRSLSTRKLTAEELGRRIKDIESEPLFVNGQLIVEAEWDPTQDMSTVWGPMDSSVWARSGESGESRGEILDRMGVGFFRADKGTGMRHSAAEQIRNRLRRRTPNARGEFVIPGLRFFRSCKTRIRSTDGSGWEETGPIVTIPLLAFDPNDPDVWDTNADDHDMDALAYGVMSRPLAGEHETHESKATGVVVEILKLREARATGSAFPDWYASDG